MNDTLTRFVLDSAPVRGGIVRLDHTLDQAIEEHAYAPQVASALGELLAATSLLASSLKWEGSLILQMQGTGALKLLCAESDHRLQVRGVANVEDAVNPTDTLSTLMPGGRVVITLDPRAIDENAQMYQGIVTLNPQGVAPTIEDYMLQSQQVRTMVVLACDGARAAGFMLQKLPGDDEASAHAYERVLALARTLTADELLTLEAETILHRLFHEEVVRVLPTQSVRFFCPCNEDRVLGALRLMGRAEVESLLEERGAVEAQCQFCNRKFSFGPLRLAELFAHDVAGNQTKH